MSNIPRDPALSAKQVIADALDSPQHTAWTMAKADAIIAALSAAGYGNSFGEAQMSHDRDGHRHYLKIEMQVGTNALDATLICRTCNAPIPQGSRYVKGWFETCHRPGDQRPASWCFDCFKKIADAIGGG